MFEELLYEDDSVKKEREKCEKLLDTYKEAAKIIGEVIWKIEMESHMTYIIGTRYGGLSRIRLPGQLYDKK